jgi:hypothetical protein
MHAIQYHASRVATVHSGIHINHAAMLMATVATKGCTANV